MNAETKLVAPTGLDLLRQPFPPHQISKLPKETKKQSEERKAGNNIEWKCAVCGGMHHKNAVHLDYVGHAALTDRLLDADPNWSWEPMGTTQEGLPAMQGGLWIKLTVCGVSRYGFGSADGKQGGDAIKEMIGDALRNAAMRFGAALDLWHKGDLHVDEEEDGPKPDPVPTPTNLITRDQTKVILDLLPDAGVTEGKLLQSYGGVRLGDLTEVQAANAIKRLEKTILAKRPTVEDILDDEIPY